MIDIKTAERIHDILIDQFGGSKGLRDRNALDSALVRPYGTFDGKDLYPTPIDKAAALFESLIIGHPFVDGNKRISYVLMRILLLVWPRHRSNARRKILLCSLQPAPANYVSTTSRTGFRNIQGQKTSHNRMQPPAGPAFALPAEIFVSKASRTKLVSAACFLFQ